MQDIQDIQDIQNISQNMSQDIMSQNLLQISNLLQSDDTNKVYQGIIDIRRLTMTRNKKQYENIMFNILNYEDFNFMKKFSELLKQQNQKTNMLIDLTWIFINIAASKYSKIIVDYELIKHLCSLLQHNHVDIREHCAQCLGNIAGDSTESRDLIIQEPHLIDNLIFNIENCNKISLLQNIFFIISNLYKGHPPANFDILQPTLIYISQFVLHYDTEIKLECLWTLSYFTHSHSVECLQQIIHLNIVPILIQLLICHNNNIIVPTLRTLGNITASELDEHTQYLIDHNILPNIDYMLNTNENKRILKESCWLLSNICAGTSEQLEIFIHTPNVLLSLNQMLLYPNKEIQREALWAIYNFFTGPNEYIDQIVIENKMIIENLCQILSDNSVEAQMFDLILEIFTIILKISDIEQDVLEMFEEFNIINRIIELQVYDNESIQERSSNIMSIYYQNKNIDEVQYL